MNRLARTVAVLCSLVLALVAGGAAPSATAAAAAAANARPSIIKVGAGAGPLRPTLLVITGRNLRKADGVRFGTRSGKVVKVVNDRMLRVRTPRGVRPGTVQVRVHTPAGWSSKRGSARYAFVAAPRVSSLSPATGSYVGGQRVTLKGRALDRTKVVRFGDSTARIVSRSASRLVVETPLGVLGRTGVRAQSPGGTSSSASFTYVGGPARESSTVQGVAGGYTALTVQWVTGGVDPDTGEATPWTVSLPPGATAPAAGQAFLVAPGTANFVTGLTGTVESVAVQTDESLRVTVLPADLEDTIDKLVIDYSGSVTPTTDQAVGRRAVETSVEWPVNGSALVCRDPDGQSVAFGADFTMSVSDIDVSQHLEMGGLFSKPSYDGTFTAEVTTTGKFHGEVASTCGVKPSWQNANRKVIPLGTSGLTVSFAPAFEFSVSAKGTLTLRDRTRTTFAINAKLGETPRLSRTSRTVESTVGGALSFDVTVAGGVAVQFGLLDRVGLEGNVMLALSGGLEAADSNVCVTVKLSLQLSVGLFFDAWVRRWESPTLNATIDLYELLRKCVRAEQEDPPTDEPRIVSTRLPDAQLGHAYDSALETEDGRNGTWSIGRYPLPAGLTLDPGTGTISGTPTGPVGDYPVIIDFVDGDGRVATTTVRVRVQPDTGIGGGDIQVTLRWSGPADLDLHVLDPSGEEIYYGNSSSDSGGTLDHDANAGCNGIEDDDNPVENVFWPPNAAPVGTYAARVVVYAECSGPLSWQLIVRRGGVVIIDQTGSGSSSDFTFAVGSAGASGAARGARWGVGSYPRK